MVASAWWTETRDALKHPARSRAAPTIKNDLVQNVGRSEFEKPFYICLTSLINTTLF